MSDAARVPSVALPLPFTAGQVIEYDYPRHNFWGIPSRFERRLLLVESIRDLNAQPLEEETLQANPLQRRSRWLVTGRDLRKHAERSFYLGSMENVRVVDPPPPEASQPAGAEFQVWIVEETEEFSGVATLAPAGVYTDDAQYAKAWAAGFNETELEQPINAWAVVRRSNAA